MRRSLILFPLVATVVAAAACSAGGGDPNLWRRGDVSLEGGGGATSGIGGADSANVAVTSGGGANQGPATTVGVSTVASTGAAVTSTSVTTGAASTSASTSVASTSVSSTAASTAASSSSTGMAGTTWTEVYNAMFAPSTGNCSRNGGCHTNSKSGFKCGTTASTCYTGLVNAGWVSPGANASSSSIVDPNQSFFCGSLGGNMPPNGDGSCPSSSDVTMLKDWLADGAPNN